MVDTETKKVMDYNVTDTAKRYFGKLNEEFHKGKMCIRDRYTRRTVDMERL